MDAKTLENQAVVTKVVVTDEHFLYLPLYYAHSKNYFGLLPPNHTIEIIRSRSFTDESAYSMLMDNNSPRYRGIDIAVCDPTCVLLDNDPYAHPVVLAGLLTNSAFWAVNHKANRVRFLEQLATFDKIISFRPGSTSFGIASRIFRDPSKAQNIVTVNPQEELAMLVTMEPNTVALSPDILGIQHLLESRDDRYGIELVLASTREYRDMLVTALLTRRDVMTNKPDLIQALLTAVQRSLVSVRNRTEEVIDFAASRFNQEKDTVRNALNKAFEAEVYPTNIRISQPTWIKLAEIAADSWQQDFDDVARARALESYHRCVEPYSICADMAVKKVESPILSDSLPVGNAALLPVLLEIIPPLFLIVLALAHYLLTSVVLSWYVYAGLVSFAVFGAIIAHLAGIRPFFTLSGLLYWIPLAPVAVAALALANLEAVKAAVKPYWDIDINSTLTKVGLIGFIAGMLYRVSKHVNSEKRNKAR